LCCDCFFRTFFDYILQAKTRIFSVGIATKLQQEKLDNVIFIPDCSKTFACVIQRL
jgi:hypothetical protein